MKKVVSLMLITLILFNCIMNGVVYAEDDTHYTSGTVDFGAVENLGELEASSNPENWNSLFINGTATVKEQELNQQTGEKTEITVSQAVSIVRSTILTGVLKAIISIFVLIPKALNWLLSKVVGTTTFTIAELLSDEYDIVGIRFWQQNTTGPNSNIVNPIRKNVAIWYYSVRNIAVVAMVVILIYIGIRMALLISVDDASAKQRARYKQMLINWFVGLALMFALHIIIIFIITMCDILSKMIIDITNTLTSELGADGIETGLVEHTWSEIWRIDNTHPVWTFIIYFMLVVYQIKFFIAYLFRALRIYLYIIISPLVCMTYSIDKIKDNKSQAFESWLREFLGDVLMQPIQLIGYTIFILSASELMRTMPILLVILLASLSNIDKILTKIILGGKPQFSKAPGEFKLTEPGAWMNTK